MGYALSSFSLLPGTQMTRPLTITLVTPARATSRSGNRVTADRWQALMQALGHRINVVPAYDGAPADVLIAIHAWRSADAVSRFAQDQPGKPIVVCLSGTDIYAYQASHAEVTHGSMTAATILVGLHDLVARSIPERYHSKLRIIHQSAVPVARRPPATDAFDVCVIGHLREEKDPFRTARAVRLLPPLIPIRVTHVGAAIDASWATRAEQEMGENPRYRWLGEVPATGVADLLAATRLMVLSSVSEGGANVLGEAIVAGVPVIASAIEGSLGLLGLDYPGTYRTGDTQALAHQLQRAVDEPAFLADLSKCCVARAPLFTPQRERAAWVALLAEVIPSCERVDL